MKKHTSDNGIVIGAMDGRRALLADFDIDDDQLKPKHREWLDGLARIIRRSHLTPPHGMWVVAVTGRASKTGSNVHNFHLSERRANAVRSYLVRSVGPFPIACVPKALGEEMPHDPIIDDNERDRSVEVFARPNVFIEPTLPKKNPKIPAPDKIFDLVVDNFLLVVGEGTLLRFGTWIINLTIFDPVTDFGASYFFEGSGSCAPVANKFLVAATEIRSVGVGARQPFSAHHKLDINSFAGDAGITIPHVGVNHFRFGGNKLTDLSKPRQFPIGEIENFKLPRADRNLPFFASATGKLKRGVQDVF